MLPSLRVSILITATAVSLLLLGEQIPLASAQEAPSPAAPPIDKPAFSHEVLTVINSDDRGEKLRMPSALFFDHKANELYLLNGGEGRLIVYGPDYFPQESLAKGRGIDTPVGGTIDDKGNLYIPQAGNVTKSPRLTILNSAFLPLQEIDLSSMPEVDTFTPQEIALAHDGRTYLVGNESKRVLVLNPDGTFSHWFAIAISKNGDYRQSDQDASQQTAILKNVVVDALGNLLFLSEETSRIYVFDANEHYLFSFGSKGGAEGKMSRPRALAIDEHKRCIYVVDYMRHTVLIFDFTGTFRFEFGGLGWGPGWFNYPVDIVLGRQGQVVVADFFNQRAQVFEVALPDFPERPAKLWQTGTELPSARTGKTTNN